jgi:glycerate dehydrogenase
MRIVVLDGYTLNPGDLSWDRFQSLGECVVYDRTPRDAVVARAQGAQLVLTNKTVVSREAIAQLPELQYIGVLATGFNIVDTQAAAERRIPVANVPEYGTASVAQMVFAHVLHLCHHVGEHSQSVRDGKWTRCPDFCFWDYPLIELAGRTMGVLGLGRIGGAVANIARAFGMKVLATKASQKTPVPAGIVLTDLQTLFRESDVISLHCPLTESTRGIVNRELLSIMKPTAFLINTSRGPLIDEQALADALNQGVLAGAGLDVLAVEPPTGESPLMTARNCHITPHIAWATWDARRRLMDTAFENAAAFVRGERINLVNGC